MKRFCTRLTARGIGGRQTSLEAGRSQVAQVGKNPPVNEGDRRDGVSIPGSETSPGGGNGNPRQYSCWRIPWTEEPPLQSVGSQRVRHN